MQHGHDESQVFSNKIIPYFIKYFKSLFENAVDTTLVNQGLDLLKSLVEQYGSFGKAVDLKEMEKMAKGVNRKIKNLDKEPNVITKREMRLKEEEERDEIEKKLRRYQFRMLYKAKGMVIAVRERVRDFVNFAMRNRKAKKMYEAASSQ